MQSVLGLDKDVGELVDRHARQTLGIGDNVQNFLLVIGVVVVRNVPLELVDQEGGSLSAAPLVSNGVLNLNFVEDCAVVELDKESVSDRALLRVVIVNAESRIFNAVNLGAESVNARVRRRFVRVALGSQFSKDERVGNHVVNRMISISEVVKRTLLVNDADGGFLSADSDTLDVVRSFTHGLELVMDDMSSLNGCLRVEFRRERDLEKNIFHNVRGERPLELELLALEKDIVEAPSLGGQDGR